MGTTRSHRHTDTDVKRRGRPVTREIKLDAAPEEVARAMFAAVKPPDPSKRVRFSK